MEEKNTGKWVKVEEILQQADKKELIDLIRDMYGRSTEERMLINARFLGDNLEKKRAQIQEYREIIKDNFQPDSGEIRYFVAERTINDYTNKSGDLAGTLELMLTYVESGTRFVTIFGVLSDDFFDSIEGILSKLCELLKTEEGQKYYPDFRERLFKVFQDSEGTGWGFGEMIYDHVEDIDCFFGGDLSDFY